MTSESVGASPRPITLGRAQLFYAALFVLVVVPLVVWMVSGEYLYGQYVLAVKAPILRHQFGFQVNRVQIGSPPDAYEIEVISSVLTGGVPARAGFRPGDVPLWHVEGGPAGFYQDLQAVLDGHEITLRVTTVSALQVGSGEQRRITLVPSALTPGQ